MKFINQKSLFKVFGVGTLATCMLATSLFAFIPNPTQAETLNSNQNPSSTQTTTPTTESTGLITPRADDLVLFTTESGLEIKYGNATFQGDMNSGNLTGFPYFRTSKDGKNYDWVIIGSRYNLFLTSRQDPAETAIEKDLARILQIQVPAEVYPSIIHNEIPEGCYLILSNTLIEKCESSYWFNARNNSYQMAICQRYYNEDTFGFGNLLTRIRLTDLTTNMAYSSVNKNQSNFFTLSHGSNSDNSFIVSKYLTSSQRAASGVWILREVIGNGYPSCVLTSGNLNYSSQNVTYWVRPACIFEWGSLN